MDVLLIPAAQLHNLVRDIFAAAQCPPDEAKRIALYLVKANQLGSLPACDTFPSGERFPGFRCMQLTTSDHGSDYANITAVVAIRVS